MKIGFESKSKGSSGNSESFLKQLLHTDMYSKLDHYGQAGVNALSRATPTDQGVTANSWTYEIVRDHDSYSIIWGNTHIEDGRPIAVLIQYGHATRTGGYVHGRDYINPALQPIFDQIEADAWKVVTSV